MKTSTKTKTARIVIGELPSAGTSGPLNLNSAAVAAVHGGMAAGAGMEGGFLNPATGYPYNYPTYEGTYEGFYYFRYMSASFIFPLLTSAEALHIRR